ncbi:MAG TPA: NAD(P)-dependent oxidoreductase [Sphingomonas sp.]|uniref:NAD(P)-dependent oxidoreductase n=1 Tax=Sphingomonas sp. TaxID=28214 RepID=UPI002CF2AA66|nr:NAD(P)-dependent oxidoreductase [Sphingomonas sp.]HMI18783.1 NAD(P)-dependent oxidoreductase [Sphingomonas sp.]
MKIGFIGLGNMGSAIARNLIKAGHEVTVWNRSPGKADALVGEGAKRAATPAEAASGAVVHTMLADDKAVEAVTFGPDGILSASAKAIHVSHSTIGLPLAERLAKAHAEHGSALIAAPVFGRPAAAEAAKLFIAAAGPADALSTCQPLFDAIGQKSFTIGDHPPAANLVKLCGNFLILATIESLAEAMTLGEKGGVPKAKLLEVLTGSLFGAPVYQTYGDILVKEAFHPAGFAAPLGLKDMNLVSQAATDARVPMPVLAVLRDHLLSTIAREGEDIDWSGIARIIAADAGL